MIVTHKITIDLCRRGITPVVHMVQGDSNTRALEISLYDNGQPWKIPEGVTAAVAFSKADGTRGLYDKLPDKSNATTLDGSTVTAILAPEVLTCAGQVGVAIVLYDAEMDTLSTFTIMVVVEANPAAGEQVSNNYYYLQNMEQVNAAYADILTRLDELKIEAGTEVPANAAEMKVLTIGGEAFEVVDEKARSLVDDLGVEIYQSATRKNLINKNAITIDAWYYNGAIQRYPEDSQYCQNYCFTDYIPVEGGKKYVYSGRQYYEYLTYLHSYAYFDKDKTFISGEILTFKGDYYVFDIPSNVAYLIINDSKAIDDVDSGNPGFLGSKVQLEKGEVPTEYEEYKEDAELITGYYLPQLAVKQEQIEGLSEKFNGVETAVGKVEQQLAELPKIEERVEQTAKKMDALSVDFPERKNLIDLSKTVSGSWASTTNGVLEVYPDNPYIEGYCRTDYIPVIGGGEYVFNTSAGGKALLSYVYYDADKNFVSSGTNGENAPVLLSVPESASYIILNGSISNGFLANHSQLEKGTTPTEYEEYIPDADLAGYYMPDLKVKSEQIEDFVLPETEYNILHLPPKYDLVVGDTFELFYKGVMLCKDPYRYNIQVQCNIGKAWGRKFEVMPTAAGNYTLNIAVSDDNGKVLDTGSTILSVSPKMTAPSKNVNVLCIGDSLTEGGVWVDEVYRRLTKTTDKTQYNHEAPTGDGLTNINFLGKRTTANGAGYEGNGGWKFANYNDTSTAVNAYWVTATHNKTDSDQESVYADVNGVQWQLETIEAGRLKFKKYAGEGTINPNGTLTWVSGGVNVDAITYSTVSPEKGNPFVYGGVVDFDAYCVDIGVSGIDMCFILLGWNDAAKTENAYKADAKAFIDKLIAFNANIKITLIGLQIPSLDGCANNYGASGTYTNYRGLQEFVFNLDRWYSDIAAEYPSNVDTINLSGQFDTEHNSITAEFAVNARNPETVTVQSNGVHPNHFGQYQIADAVYRKFTADNA